MIELNGITKTFKVAKREKGVGAAAKALFHREYREVKALDHISFSIDEGEIVGYIGPNGAGKSTSIKVMSGILVPDAGTCRIMGYTPWENRRAYVKNIGVVFGQRTQLWWDVPVIDSFELLRDIYRIDEGEYKKTLELLVSSLDLAELLNTPLRQLSLGQRMRCELAASLLHSPRLLFLDEPTIGLDAVSKLAVRKFIRTINQEKGVTVILTTHDMNDIEALTNRIVLIGKGRILYDGSLDRMKNRFDSCRTVTVEFKGGCAPGEIPGAALISSGEGRSVYEVDTGAASVSEVITKLGAQLEISDLTVENCPVEEVIASLYKEFQI